MTAKRKSIQTRLKQIMGYNKPIRTSNSESFRLSLIEVQAQGSKLSFEVAEAVDEMIVKPGIIEYWSKQAKAGEKKAQKSIDNNQQIDRSDIQIQYAILAQVHDNRFEKKILKCHKNSIYRSPYQIKSYLRYVESDLKANKKLDGDNRELPKNETVHIIKSSIFKRGTKNWNLLVDLIDDVKREGVKINKRRHGTGQPRRLRRDLKERGERIAAKSIVPITATTHKFKLNIPCNQIKLENHS